MGEGEEMANFKYEFIGGKYHGKCLTYDEVMKIFNGKFSPDYTKKPAEGRLCPRKELDNSPQVDGYIGAMWGGWRYVVSGKEYYDFEFEKLPQNTIWEKDVETFGVLRYETQEAYNAFSC